jgi:hypothetical protein
MVEFLSRSIRRPCVLPSVAVALALAPALTAPAHAASPVGLGTATSFALLAGSTITNTGATAVNGDIGLCCTGLATPGFDTLTQIGGALTAGSGTPAATAQDDLDVAYDDAAGRAATATLPVNLSLAGTPANPLGPGVYESTGHGSMQILTGLTLDFAGDPNAVFIFQATDLTTAAAAAGSVTIVNGGTAPSACNIFWQLSSDATGVSLGTASAFKGTTMALGASTLGTGATVDGRILTRRSKAVTLEANTITRSTCSTETGSGGGGGGGTTTTPVSGGGTPTIPASGGASPTATAPSAAGTPTPVRILPLGPGAGPTPVSAAASGTAKLVGPSGPVRTPFAVWVTGRAIDRVVFWVDGRRIGTVRARPGRTKFMITIHPRGRRGMHRLTARITFKSSSGTSSTVRRTTYYTAGRVARTPRFAG